MSAKGSLIRRFPAHAVSIPATTFDRPKFQLELALRLAQLDVEVIEEFLPQSSKAGYQKGEVRDTANPSLVTEMIISILTTLGEAVKVRHTRKRVRDDVPWQDCLIPWRRSPVWLMIRVAIQTTLVELLPVGHSTTEYKNFMLFFLTDLAARAPAAALPDDLCHVISAKIARRCSKLCSELFDFVQDKALLVCKAVKDEQWIRWQAIQKDDADRSATIERRPFENDTSLNLQGSEYYLNSILQLDEESTQIESAFMPYHQDWLGQSRGLPSFKNMRSSTEESIYALAEFETWIADSLPTWKEQQLSLSTSDIAENCMTLATLAVKYRELAMPVYCQASE